MQAASGQAATPASERTREQGFSILELLVAIGILSVALMGLLGALNTGQKLNALSRERVQAITKARSMVETVLSSEWDALDSWNGWTFAVEVEPGAVDAGVLSPIDGQSNTGSVAVSDTGIADLKRVEVSVQWKSVIGKDIQITLSSLIGKH